MKIRIDELRKLRGLSVEKLAEKMHITRPYLQALKSGQEKRFNIDHFESLLRIFDCSVHDLFDDHTPKKRLLDNAATVIDYQVNRQTLQKVIEKMYELFDDYPAAKKEITAKEMAEVIAGLYEQAIAEEIEVGRPVELTKVRVHEMLRLVHVRS